MLNKNGNVPKITPSEIINPAITLSNTCPATIFAKSRTERVSGLIKKEISSIINIIGAMNKGTPLGKNICINPPNPFLTMAKIVIVKNAIIANEKVITI